MSSGTGPRLERLTLREEPDEEQPGAEDGEIPRQRMPGEQFQYEDESVCGYQPVVDERETLAPGAVFEGYHKL